MPKILTSHTAPSYASAPSNPMLGDVYYNTTEDSTYVYSVVSNVQTWVKLGGKVKVQAYTTPGSYTWTRPENVQWIKAVVVAGAGGGGGAGGLRTNAGAQQSVGGGGGGSGGSIVIAYDLYVGDLSSISVFVPSGGSGAAGQVFTKAAGDSATATTATATSGSSGGAGSAATFGSYISCPSGLGGSGAISATATSSTAATGAAAPSAPTVTGLYNYISVTGAAGGAGGNVATSVPAGGTTGGISAASYSADGSSSGRAGQNRIQWSSEVLTSARNSQTNPTSSVSSANITVVAGANPSGGTGTYTAFGSGGSGGAAAYVVNSASTVVVAGSNTSPVAGYNASVGAYSTSTTATTLTINGGKSQSGGKYANGGAGGSAVGLVSSGSTSYNPHTLNLTACSGGDGANGLVSIAWIE